MRARKPVDMCVSGYTDIHPNLHTYCQRRVGGWVGACVRMCVRARAYVSVLTATSVWLK